MGYVYTAFSNINMCINKYLYWEGAFIDSNNGKIYKGEAKDRFISKGISEEKPTKSDLLLYVSRCKNEEIRAELKKLLKSRL